MQIYFTLSSFIHLVGFLLGQLVAIILWFYSGPRPYPYRKLLSGFYGCLAVGLGISFLIETRLLLEVPHIYRTGNIFGLLFMPFSYLYFRSVIKHRPPGWLDLLHGLPALLYIIDYLPFFLLPAAAKEVAFIPATQDLSVVLAFSEGWITPPFFHLVLRSVQFATYWFLQAILIGRLYRIKDRKVFFRENRGWLRFAVTLLGFQFFMFTPILVALIIGWQQYFWLASQVSAALVMVFSALVLFFRPKMLYGIQGLIQYPEEEPAGDPQETPSYLNEDAVKEMRAKLNNLMEKDKLFLNSGYSLADLSRDMDLPSYKLTMLLNKELDQNFNDYINRHRINYCLKKMEAGEWRQLTIQGMAQECGFNNRNSFTSAFKKFAGKTPSTYLRTLDE